MKKHQKTPQWIIAKRMRKAAKRYDRKVVKPHGSKLIKHSH